jgi:hypothetical protein
MIHVVTPFSRPNNARVLVDHLERQGVALTWHPLVGSVEFPWDCLREWVRPLRVDVPAGCDPFCYKLRAFVESGRIEDGERYGVLCDDDLYDEGLLGAVAGMDEPIVVVSMLRGHSVPAHSTNGYLHPTWTLTAAAEMMRPGGVGLQQCFVMGEIFREAAFDLERAEYCDGLVAEWMAREYEGEIRYEPELYVLFNRLEPGRWAVDADEVALWR